MNALLLGSNILNYINVGMNNGQCVTVLKPEAQQYSPDALRVPDNRRLRHCGNSQKTCQRLRGCQVTINTPMLSLLNFIHWLGGLSWQ